MRNIFVIAILVVLFSISSASAQFLGQLTPAPTLNKGDGLIGAYMGVYEEAFSVFGQFRHGLARYVDFGLKMGLVDFDQSQAGMVMGGDVKHWFMEQRTGDPLDVSFGVGTEYLNVSDFGFFSLGGSVIASYQIDYHERKSVTPYGRLNMRWEKARGGYDDFDIGLSLGADLKLSSNLSLVGELEIEDNVGFAAGINYNLF